MEATKLQTMKKMGLILLLSIVTSLVMVMCNTTKSYAGETIYDREHCQVEEIYKEYQSDISETWGVDNNQHNIVHVYNLRNDDGTLSNFDFEYDYRGYDGNELNSEAGHIQYFYNSSTCELAIIRVGWNYNFFHKKPYYNGTYIHGPAHATVFEREQDFDESPNNIRIASYVKHVYIDPSIDYIGNYSLINFRECESVDMINHCYKSSTMGNGDTRYACSEKEVNCLCTDCFEYIGDHHKLVPVELPFLHLFNSVHRKDVIDNYKHRGFDDSNIVFHEGIYENHFNITKSNDIESVTDMTGAEVPSTFRCPANSKYYTIKIKTKNGVVPVVNDSCKNIPVAYNAELHEYTCTLDIQHYNTHNIKITTETTCILSGQARLMLPDGDFKLIGDGNIDFIADDGQVYHGCFGLFCMFRIEVPIGIKGKVQYTKNNLKGCSDEFIVTPDTSSLFIDVHTT